MKFFEVAKTFQAVEQESSRIVMTKLFANLLQKSSAHDAQILAYISLGSLFPPYQTLQFNVAKSGMINVIAQLCQISEKEVQIYFKKVGDLGLVVFDLWNGDKKELSLHYIYQELCLCAQIAGIGSTEKKNKYLVNLLTQVDNLSAKFIVRIITGTLRLGFSDMTFLDALSWMEQADKSLSKKLEHAYNICTDLGLVAKTLKSSGLIGIEKMHIQVGIPIRPAAAERADSAQEIIDRLGICVAQPKLDGFRLQVHSNKDGKINFFSRNLLDMSTMFPELTQAIESLPVKNFIGEGEAIGFNVHTKTFLPFQETVKRKRKHGIDKVSEELPLILYFFDILYLDGHSLLNLSHEQRRQKLLEVFKNNKNKSIQVIDEKVIKTSQELEKYFLEVRKQGLEGLVVKRDNASYQPGKRNFNWIKLKYEATGKHHALADTIDCVILGYYKGKGKRAHFGIGALLIGIYDIHKNIFETVAKLGTGLTDQEWKEIKKRCDELAVQEQPKNVHVAKSLIPDVWLNPEVVCEVKADEITLSPVHSAGKTEKTYGYALRFPRFISYRTDKSAKDTTTLKEIKHLYDLQKK